MKIKTLVADDNFESRKRLIEILSDIEDIEIIYEAVNGEEEIEKIKELKPELVFTDNQMPYYNGTEVISKIMMELAKDIPTFIIVTGDLYLHCDDAFAIINKPADRNKILDVLNEYYLLKDWNSAQ